MAKEKKIKAKKQKVEKQKTRKMNIRTKILLPVLIIIMIVSAGMGTMMYLVGQDAYLEAGIEKSHLAATIASSLIDGSKVMKIHNETDLPKAFGTKFSHNFTNCVT